MGITCHEANDLAASASYFQRAATEAGGCGVGMLMWGLTLRHGWGVAADEKTAFKWLRKAAESAVVDLEGARKGAKAGVDITSVKVRSSSSMEQPLKLNFVRSQSELVLAIYEVAQCFFHGWGVSKDQKMAVVSSFCCNTALLSSMVVLRATIGLQRALGTLTPRLI
jgi:TPR repeat protein